MDCRTSSTSPLAAVSPAAGILPQQRDWLLAMLQRNAGCDYLRRYGAPHTVEAFCAQVPCCGPEDLQPWLQRMLDGERDVLFSGSPVAWERTAGSTGAARLLPCSEHGLLDFQNNLAPWLQRTLDQYDITGGIYLAASTIAQPQQHIHGAAIGLPDGAYVGPELATRLVSQTVMAHRQWPDIASWRDETLHVLRNARNLELISVWSPTFLMRLLDEIPDPQDAWPHLKLVSCWTSAAARPHAEELATRLPQAHIQPKGLMATEGVVTVPDAVEQPALATSAFTEFLAEDRIVQAGELQPGEVYEVLMTTASGLYRYRSGDLVRMAGWNPEALPVLHFVGRHSLYCDLVGEKLHEAFVGQCLQGVPGEPLLVPDTTRTGYVLVSRNCLHEAQLQEVENRLCANPQYAWARALTQLAPLRQCSHPQPFTVVEQVMLERGTRPGDIKPAALRKEAFWLALFEKDCA